MSEVGLRLPEREGTRAGAGSRLVYMPSIYLALLLFGLTAVGFYLLIRLQFLLILLFLSVLLACGVAGPVRRLEQWRLPRSLAIGLVYLGVLGVFAGIGWYVLPRLVGQAVNIAQDIPNRIEQTEQWRRRVEDLGRDYPILEQLDARLTEFASGAGEDVATRLLEMPRAFAKAIFSLVTIFTIAFLLLMAKERLLDVLLSVFHPRQRATTRRVLDEMGVRLGAYLRSKIIVMVIVGTLVFATLFALGSPYAVLVAIFAGTFEALPRIGPWIGRAGIAVAVLPLGWEKVAIAMVAHVVIENLKGLFLSPIIEGNQVDIYPLTAFVAIIAGGLLLGWVGAFIAVPAAAVVQVVVEDVLIPWRHRQLAAAEQEYFVGPPVPEPDPSEAGLTLAPRSTSSTGPAPPPSTVPDLHPSGPVHVRRG